MTNDKVEAALYGRDRLLVIGARDGSLGDRIAQAAGIPFETFGAGMSDEPMLLDVRDQRMIERVLEEVLPHHIVVTAGLNLSAETSHVDYPYLMRESFEVNVIGVMDVLGAWLRLAREVDQYQPKTFVAISSNSAHIARRNSGPYCATKAALSMAIRVAAREIAGKGPLVYGYEPGLLEGTPMTKSTSARFGPIQTRIPGAPDGLDPDEMAKTVVQNLIYPSRGLNGSLLRLDGGEQ